MRLAQSNDIWRGLYKARKRQLESVSMTYREVADGPELLLSLQAPISLLCGENGVGKSRALRALHAALGAKLSPIDFRPKAGPKPSHIISVSALVRRPSEDKTLSEPIEILGIESISNELKDSSGESRIFSFDPTLQIPYLLHLLRHDGRLSDLWEGVDPKKLDSDQLADVSALVGRTYSSIDFYEISDFSDHEIIPYFRVTSNSETYGSEEMGLGELSLLFFYWTLSRLEHASVILLEEPETFVAPKSQRNLIDFLAAKTEEKELFAIIASHSGIIAERVPGTHIDYVSRMGRTVSFLRNPARNIMADRLALAPPKSVLAILEDQAGVFLARALLEAGNSKYLSHCTLLIAGGESQITNVLKALAPSESKNQIVMIGLYDGDQKKSLPKDVFWPVLCLPGTEAPEIFARNWLTAHTSTLDRLLNRRTEQIIAALGAMDGQNPHDWLVGLGSILQMSLDELFRRIAQGMFESEPTTVAQFNYEFESKLIGRVAPKQSKTSITSQIDPTSPPPGATGIEAS